MALPLISFLFCFFCLIPLEGKTTQDLTLKGNKFSVNIALTPQDLQQGLMHRTHLPMDQGMLFIFPQKGHACFWMKETSLSLDLLYLDEKGHVLELHPNLTPFSQDKICSKQPILMALEINAGLIQSLGLKRGDRVKFNRQRKEP